MNLTEAVHRTHYALTRLRYRTPQLAAQMTFERSFPLSGLFLVHPHHIHSRVDVSLTELPDGTCRANVRQEIFKLGSPSSKLDKHVWKGDLDDLEAQLTRREPPRNDRFRENAHAGKMSLIYLGVTIPVTVVIAIVVGVLLLSPLAALVAWLLLFLPVAYALPHLPFKMPEFPVENFVPDPPFDSNYPRTGISR